MACRGARKNQAISTAAATPVAESVPVDVAEHKEQKRLLFGVDSMIQSDDLLQNNITEFEWVVRNKVYPNFWGRYLTGENCLTREEINFLHSKGCKIAAIYQDPGDKQTEEQGRLLAKKVVVLVLELGIPEGTVIFLEIGEKETVNRDFMRGFADVLTAEGFTPGFKVNTDAKFTFDREFSRGLQGDRNVFSKCLVWAVAPSLAEYERVTTTHLIHPDNWIPYAPSGITRNDIAIWQYGKDCHPIHDDTGKETTFNVNLVKNEQVVIEKMF